jgi:hypothetical protein
MDPIGLYIATMHQLLGHDKTAVFLGVPPYNPATCVLCCFERGEATKDDVQEAIGTSS